MQLIQFILPTSKQVLSCFLLDFRKQDLKVFCGQEYTLFFVPVENDQRLDNL